MARPNPAALVVAWAIAILVALAGPAPAFAETRFALVIGNADYVGATVLRNPTRDADDIALALEALNFTVHKHHDLTGDGFNAAVEAFATAARGADVALVYYSGHALQIDGGNYLVPTDAEVTSPLSAKREGFALLDLMSTVGRAARTTLVFLDACRDNPFEGKLQAFAPDRSAVVSRGLAPINLESQDTLVVFATTPGEVASDGMEDNSPFTKAVLRHVATPGVEIETLLKRVTASVRDATGGRQQPERVSRLTSEFYFVRPETIRDAEPGAVDRAFFAVQSIGSVPAYDAFLSRFPTSHYTDYVTDRRNRLVAEATLPGPATVATDAAPSTAPKPPVTVTIQCGGSGGLEYDECRAGSESWARRTGNTVKIVTAPTNMTDRLAFLQRALASGGEDIDILQIDITWPRVLADDLIDLGEAFPGARTDFFPSLIANNTVDGRLLAIPWYVDAGVLYYRSDLLEKHGLRPPRTWTELADQARLIQRAERKDGRSGFWGFAFQGAAYEGLTVNALEWMARAGLRLVDETGATALDPDTATGPIAAAAAWIGTIAPREVLSYEEENGRMLFQTGNAAFLRSWPYAWSLMNQADSPVRGKVGITDLPASDDGRSSTAVLGGWQLAVARRSAEKAEAIDLVRFLTSRDELKRRAISANYPPTRPDLYMDDAILVAVPFFEDFPFSVSSGVLRPSGIAGDRYPAVSEAVFTRIGAILDGADVRRGLRLLVQDIGRIRGDGWNN
ncbi:extracellular solute-binding protein [Mongoliimonas terrestris]|uniref:extracellular solute-binding protein n=1 Tax=Mongoliimonas terrestris TaxID=1709001 RepID=UPI000B2C9B86|nr:extracellular solute-binding protein [Mongoliimonas terrestris]